MKSSSAAVIPRISVTTADEHHDHIAPLKPPTLKIDTAHAQNTNTVWYDEDSESSSSASSSEDEDEEQPYRPMHLAPPPSLSPVHIPIQQQPRSPRQQQQQSLKPTLNVNNGVGAGGPPRSPCSPLRNSFTPIIVEAEESRKSPLPEDKKGLDRARVEDLVHLRERRAHMMMNMRIQTTGLTEQQEEKVTSPVPVQTPTSARRPTMDLRREITLKAHAAKHAEERRQSFLARLRASPSSSPTTLTTPVTPPDSPAEFHYTLPSPGLVSPLALFEAYSLQQQIRSLGQQSQAISEDVYERVERVNWAQQQAARSASENDEVNDDLRSPPARISNVFSRGISGAVGAERKKGAQSTASADFNRLPIGVGRLQIPARTGLHALKPHHQGVPIVAPSTTAVGSSKILSGLDLTTTTSVVVPPRRDASLPAAPARPKSHQLPSLLEISERLASGKKNAATSTKARAGAPAPGLIGSGRPRTPILLPIPASSHTGTGTGVGEKGRTANVTANVRAAAFPGFLRERTRLQQQPASVPVPVPAPTHSTLTVHQQRPRSEMRIIISDADTPEIPAVVVCTPTSSVASPTSPAAFAINSSTAPAEKVDNVLVVPPARPKSVDAALQERKQRGNAMMARLSMSSTHRRRKSESSVPLLMQQVQPLSVKTGTVELKSTNNHHAAADAAHRRPGAGWF